MEIKDLEKLIVDKCKEALAPLCAELEATQPKEEPKYDFSEDIEYLRNEGLIK